MAKERAIQVQPQDVMTQADIESALRKSLGMGSSRAATRPDPSQFDIYNPNPLTASHRPIQEPEEVKIHEVRPSPPAKEWPRYHPGPTSGSLAGTREVAKGTFAAVFNSTIAAAQYLLDPNARTERKVRKHEREDTKYDLGKNRETIEQAIYGEKVLVDRGLEQASEAFDEIARAIKIKPKKDQSASEAIIDAAVNNSKVQKRLMSVISGGKVSTPQALFLTHNCLGEAARIGVVYDLKAGLTAQLSRKETIKDLRESMLQALTPSDKKIEQLANDLIEKELPLGINYDGMIRREKERHQMVQTTQDLERLLDPNFHSKRFLRQAAKRLEEPAVVKQLGFTEEGAGRLSREFSQLAKQRHLAENLKVLLSPDIDQEKQKIIYENIRKEREVIAQKLGLTIEQTRALLFNARCQAADGNLPEATALQINNAAGKLQSLSPEVMSLIRQQLQALQLQDVKLEQLEPEDLLGFRNMPEPAQEFIKINFPHYFRPDLIVQGKERVEQAMSEDRARKAGEVNAFLGHLTKGLEANGGRELSPDYIGPELLDQLLELALQEENQSQRKMARLALKRLSVQCEPGLEQGFQTILDVHDFSKTAGSTLLAKKGRNRHYQYDSKKALTSGSMEFLLSTNNLPPGVWSKILGKFTNVGVSGAKAHPIWDGLSTLPEIASAFRSEFGFIKIKGVEPDLFGGNFLAVSTGMALDVQLDQKHRLLMALARSLPSGEKITQELLRDDRLSSDDRGEEEANERTMGLVKSSAGAISSADLSRGFVEKDTYVDAAIKLLPLNLLSISPLLTASEKEDPRLEKKNTQEYLASRTGVHSADLLKNMIGKLPIKQSALVAGGVMDMIAGRSGYDAGSPFLGLTKPVVAVIERASKRLTDADVLKNNPGITKHELHQEITDFSHRLGYILRRVVSGFGADIGPRVLEYKKNSSGNNVPMVNFKLLIEALPFRDYALWDEEGLEIGLDGKAMSENSIGMARVLKLRGLSGLAPDKGKERISCFSPETEGIDGLSAKPPLYREDAAIIVAVKFLRAIFNETVGSKVLLTRTGSRLLSQSAMAQAGAAGALGNLTGDQRRKLAGAIVEYQEEMKIYASRYKTNKDTEGYTIAVMEFVRSLGESLGLVIEPISPSEKGLPQEDPNEIVGIRVIAHELKRSPVLSRTAEESGMSLPQLVREFAPTTDSEKMAEQRLWRGICMKHSIANL